MAIGIYSILIEGDTVTKLNGYSPTIDDHEWQELNVFAKELDLHCLQYVYYAGDCVFNYLQCQEILEVEIPLLRTKNLSDQTKKVLNGLESAIKDMCSKSIFAYLKFEGD